MSNLKSGLERLAREGTLHPQESLVQVKAKKQELQIGIPKEVSRQENRVSLTPEAVGLLVNNGHEVLVETKAGETSKYQDNEYVDAGARIVYDRKTVFESQVTLKVEPPTLEEIDLLKSGNVIISALQLGDQNKKNIEALQNKKVTAVAYELIQDRDGGRPVVRAMSEIAGSASILIAGEYLNSSKNGKGILLGGITGVPPAKVVILGAGTVGEFAARAVLGLGACVEIYDNEIYKLRRIKTMLGTQVYTSIIDPVVLANTLENTDLLIGAIRAETGKSKVVISEEMIANMKPESMVIDISIDQGGCIETSETTSHKDPVFRKYDVIHYCVPNIASAVPRTATKAFSHIFGPMLLQVADEGGIDGMIFNNEWFMKGVYIYRGSLTNEDIAHKYGLHCKDLELLRAARI
ncbi:MAG: alanine dehydrogenase [Bacteroidota bacterium]